MTTQFPSTQHILEKLCSNNTSYHFPEEHKKNVKLGIFAQTSAKKCPERTVLFVSRSTPTMGLWCLTYIRYLPSFTQNPS